MRNLRPEDGLLFVSALAIVGAVSHSGWTGLHWMPPASLMRDDYSPPLTRSFDCQQRLFAR